MGSNLRIYQPLRANVYYGEYTSWITNYSIVQALNLSTILARTNSRKTHFLSQSSSGAMANSNNRIKEQQPTLYIVSSCGSNRPFYGSSLSTVCQCNLQKRSVTIYRVKRQLQQWN